MKRVIYYLILAVGVFACTPKGLDNKANKLDFNASVDFDFSLKNISIYGDLQPFNTEIRIDTLEENLYLVNLSLYTDFPSGLPKFELGIKYPQKFVDALWSSRTWSNHSFINIPNYSRLTSDYNIVSALSKESNNRVTLAMFDDYQGRYTGIDIKQIPDSIAFTFSYFIDVMPDVETLEFKSQIIVDFRNKHYAHSIRELAQWRLDQENHDAMTKIEPELKPVYSMWYPMHKNVPLENITHYFDSIANMGFKSVLFDDSWQAIVRFDVDTLGNWDPSQSSVIREFMEKAHENRMSVALWYSKPFAGSNNYVFKRFEGKYMQYRTSSSPILDIRYPEVREYLVKLYGDIVYAWDVDGFWFDFLNGYYPNEHIINTEDVGRDFVSVRKSLDSLRTLLQQELLMQNPGLSIQQSYSVVGPLQRSNIKTINGFLGTSVLRDVREKMVNNRLLYGEYSPFMEVMAIHPRDPEVDVAKKFHSIMFATPYVSYFSYTLPEGVKQTLDYWIRYWKTNYDYLQVTDFYAYDPVMRYPVIRSGDETKQIVVYYERYFPIDLGDFNFEMADLINSSDNEYLSVTGNDYARVDYIIYNHKGEYIDRGGLKFKQGIATLEVPIGGLARLIVK